MGTLSKKAVWGAALALWVMIPAATAAASGRSGKIDRKLQESSGSPQAVIVQTKSGAAKHRVKGRLPKRGSEPSEHQLINAFTVRMDGKEIAALAKDPDVLSVSVDADVTGLASKKKAAHTTTTTSAATSEFTAVSVVKKTLGLDNWFTGSSVTVAVIDSGIQNSADFSGRIVGFYDFTTGRGPVPTAPVDEYGHGTHVSGLIGSSGASSNGKYAGVAPGIKILALKVLDKKGSGKTSNVIAALEFAVANKDRFGIKIVNLSLGHPIYESAATDPLVGAVEAATRAGLIVVAAAGNYGTNPVTGAQGYGGIASPGNAPSVITVGAARTAGTVVRGDDRVATFSSRGPTWFDGLAKPDVVAAGSDMLSNGVDGSTLAVDYPGLIVKEGAAKYLRLNGSSMAAGVVSGLVAVMLEANNYGAAVRWEAVQADLRKNQRSPFPGAPALTPNAVKALLQYSATPLKDANGAQYDPLTQGSGEVNGLGALLLSYSADTKQPAGAFWMTNAWPASTPFGGVDEPWSQSLIWGTRMVQGNSLVDFNQAAWDDNIVWGTGEMDNIVWGTSAGDDDNIVWGTSYGDDDNIVWGTSLSWAGNASFGENIVWGTMVDWDDNIVWGTNLIGNFDGDNIVWGTFDGDDDNIVWGTLDDDNIVWGTSEKKIMVLGTSLGGGL